MSSVEGYVFRGQGHFEPSARESGFFLGELNFFLFELNDVMANANHKWAAGQMGHSVEMFQKTYTKWIDGDQNELEIAKLEANLKNKDAAAGKIKLAHH